MGNAENGNKPGEDISCDRCGQPIDWHGISHDRCPVKSSAVPYDVFRPLVDELVAAQNDLAGATALGPTFKAYAHKLGRAQLRQAKAIICICELAKVNP